METRKRINASQGAKGDWKLDCTYEVVSAGEIGEAPLNELVASTILDLIKTTESAFRADGRKLAGE
jgi:hypothetical protein